MNSEIIKSQKDVYKNQFLNFGDKPDGTFNQNIVIEDLRFKRLIKQFDFSKSKQTIHDVGCGVCALYAHLQKNGYDVEYSGTEILKEMKDLSNLKYPNIDIKIRDIINDEINDTYDYVVLAGAFNLPGTSNIQDWKKFIRAMIRSMYRMCKKGISFNFLTIYADFYNESMYYENPQEILDFCIKELSRFVIIDHCYPLYDFTITVFKSEYMEKAFNDEKLCKYF